jgi:hypothetical protein
MTKNGKTLETRAEAIEIIDAEQHWAFDDVKRRDLAAHARNLGVDLTDKDTFESVYGVKRLHQFSGSPEDAQRCVADYARKRERALIENLRFRESQHAEARAVAWTNVLTPDGQQINVTAREGASADAVVATVLALTGALRTLQDLGFKSRK